jgi:hypothetical protein
VIAGQRAHANGVKQAGQKKGYSESNIQRRKPKTQIHGRHEQGARTKAEDLQWSNEGEQDCARDRTESGKYEQDRNDAIPGHYSPFAAHH